jgi:hypothetical protein
VRLRQALIRAQAQGHEEALNCRTCQACLQRSQHVSVVQGVCKHHHVGWLGRHVRGLICTLACRRPFPEAALLGAALPDPACMVPQDQRANCKACSPQLFHRVPAVVINANGGASRRVDVAIWESLSQSLPHTRRVGWPEVQRAEWLRWRRVEKCRQNTPVLTRCLAAATACQGSVVECRHALEQC